MSFLCNRLGQPGRRCLSLAILLPLLISSVSVKAIEVYEEELDRRLWPSRPHAESIIRIPALQNIFSHFNETPGSRLSIRFPAGPAGEKWGREVANWLISMGIPIKYLELIAGSGSADRLVLTYVIRDTG